VILSPVGAYYAAGFKQVRILVEDYYVRAVPGGTGGTKSGGNYAASLSAGQKAKERGFDQVLWLDGIQRRYVEEVGAMNIFFVVDGTLVTPPLTDSFLAGVTRDSVIAVAREELGLDVQERPISIDEVLADAREAFCTGTAWTLRSVNEIGFRDRSIRLSGREVRNRLWDVIAGIQTGRLADRRGWTRLVPEGASGL
jgi:branched-chain amino acid aminotransferase